MASLGKKFDATQHDTEQTDFELLPSGTYKLEVSASEVKEEGRNKTLSLTYDVIEPEEYKGRKFWGYIDLENDDAVKQERGQKDFARLCRAVEINDIEDSDELHFIAFTAKVKKGEAGVNKAGRPYKARNSISKFYFPDEGNIPPAEIDANQPAQRPAPANDNRQAQRSAPAQQQEGKPAGRRPWGSK
ncbi:DUF669 domain-containing protein [Rhizobium sp. CBN3]|uniref:DUF669 domain-containing protein n=1 Tax=Rhizobium sp. CBN3 TaxID=3058045 RepID=UPI002673A757|nr:DUF669 domain-containing protein [Rhizobium sp. CBN3]MDO3431152.1 DUF669 domain-containing protein [Rhizobium sp. CBN3]